MSWKQRVLFKLKSQEWQEADIHDLFVQNLLLSF